MNEKDNEKEIREEEEKNEEEMIEEKEEETEKKKFDVKEFFKKINEEDVYPLIVPILFEGKELKELPLTGMKDLRGRNYEDATNLLRAEGKLQSAADYDSADFRVAILRVTTGIAIEVIRELHSVDYRTLLNVVEGFLSRVG